MTPSLKYIKENLTKVPSHLPVLIVNNKRDLMKESIPSREEVLSQLDTRDDMRYCEASMKDGFGLYYVYKFIELPFLKLQRESLKKLLLKNESNMKSSREYLSEQEASEDGICCYSAYLNRLKLRQENEKPRLHAPPAKPIPGMERYLNAPKLPPSEIPISREDERKLDQFFDEDVNELPVVAEVVDHESESEKNPLVSNVQVEDPEVLVQPRVENEEQDTGAPFDPISSLDETDSDEVDDIADNEDELGAGLGLKMDQPVSSEEEEEILNPTPKLKNKFGKQEKENGEAESFLPSDANSKEAMNNLENFLND
ncbi:Rab-like protein 6 [Cichlidogyrus casuarinus]|uniref:Rab-like protein 6 n=1 Tax=Cichlidogyrus casuarinus TaxID=1844966 RepID=A0ABD2PZI9_9PLAT